MAKFISVTSPGLVLRSTLVETPGRKSACVVSVKQALVGAAVEREVLRRRRAVGHDDAGRCSLSRSRESWR